MPVIELGNVIQGTFGPLRSAGAPGAGTTEVQTLTFGGTWLDAETFRLSFDGHTTGNIAWSATDATLVANIDAALEALASVGTGGVTTADSTLTSGLGDATVTFAGNLAKASVGIISVHTNNSVAGTLAVAETTPGVTATGRGLAKGGSVIDTTNGALYLNTGTPLVPAWTAQV